MLSSYRKLWDGATLERFNAKYTPEPNSGCWLWTASVNEKGYGAFKLNGKAVSAHRFAYEAFVGPIPEGLHIDHLCRVPCCVNPTHMEPVTSRENRLRGKDGNTKKTHCPKGHPYSGDNLYVRNGRRHCRACRTVSSYETYRRNKDVACKISAKTSKNR